MQDNLFAILHIGSSKITVLIGGRGANNTLRITGIGECRFAGYSEGTWLDPDGFSYALAHSISLAEAGARAKIDRLYVGVPGDFSTCVCKNADISFADKQHKVTLEDVEALQKQGYSFPPSRSYTLINTQPVYYALDDGRRVIQPLGLKTTRLTGCLSYIFAESAFISFVGDALAGTDVETVEFVSGALADVLYLFSNEKRDKFIILIDVGHNSTNVTVARGDGLLSLYNFSVGIKSITDALMEYFDVPEAVADTLRQKAVLSLDASDTDVYSVDTRDEILSFPAKDVNEIVGEMVHGIALMVSKCLNKCDYEMPDYTALSLTGALTELRGAKEIIGETLGKTVDAAVSEKLNNIKSDTGAAALLDMTLNTCAAEEIRAESTGGGISGFFKRLFNRNKSDE